MDHEDVVHEDVVHEDEVYEDVQLEAPAQVFACFSRILCFMGRPLVQLERANCKSILKADWPRDVISRSDWPRDFSRRQL